ncbi:tetratricopeptide repeat protein [Bacteriovorax sp. Seq25_V]|uniref:tetratricopeptide repeat protein n=1 Tax=Bacteriovorax sp. Seq25_V TaxID=1201288 RepID=UPI00038A1FAC|nr:tetratricopeptide repeat protein [Bacteriovorax sp. Seq25_V]EQC46114.1 hypothetical protein M900_1583 [Bacteriovorax sp. Seq25_V]
MTTKTADSQNFETELKTTELGEFIIKNKAIMVIIIVLVILGILGAGVFHAMDLKNEAKAANSYHAYEVSSLKDFTDSKIDADALVAAFETVSKENTAHNATFTSALLTFDALTAKGNDAQALKIIKDITAKNSFQAILLNTRQAVALEKSGDIDGAIKKLEALQTLDVKVQEGKNYIDLGRLYLKKGNNDMAKKSFEFVKTLNTESVFKSLADHYLQTLK